jgi:phospholipid transport system substrate-binding protein
MRQLFANVTLLCASMLLALNVYAADPDPADAEAVVRNTTNHVLAELKSSSNQKVYKLVKEAVRHNFNFSKMSRLVLEENWDNATRRQQKRFAKAFRNLLVCTYANALAEAAGKVSRITYSTEANDPNNPENPKKAIVFAKVYQFGKSQPLKVDYAMSYRRSKKDKKKGKPGKWKVYNVTVAGVSLVTNYRTKFAQDIKKKGINRLIRKIKKQNKKCKKK